MTRDDEHDETPDDRALAEWAKDFREAPSSVEAPSADEILARAARDTKKERLEWAGQLGGTLFATVVFLGLVVRTRSTLQAVLAAVVLPVLFGLFALFVFERMSAATGGESVAAHVARAVARNRSRHRLARAGLVALVVLTTAFWLWMPFFVLSKSERFAAEPWRLLVAVVANLIVFGLGFWRVAVGVRKSKTELQRWEALEASLTERGDSR